MMLMAIEKKVSEAERILSQIPQSEAAIQQQKPKVQVTDVVKAMAMVPVRRGATPENDIVARFVEGSKPKTQDQYMAIQCIAPIAQAMILKALEDPTTRRMELTADLYSPMKATPIKKEASV